MSIPEGAVIKAGDELAQYYYRQVRIVKAERVTPTGQIVADGRRYQKDGTEIGVRSYNSTSLGLATPEVRKEAERQAYLSFIKDVVWEREEVEKLARIVKILQEQQLERQEEK